MRTALLRKKVGGSGRDISAFAVSNTTPLVCYTLAAVLGLRNDLMAYLHPYE